MADSDEKVTFKQETISKVLHLNFKDEKTRVSGDALAMITEVARTFVVEGATRAAKRASKESSNIVTVEHFEKVLPQLLLDF